MRITSQSVRSVTQNNLSSLNATRPQNWSSIRKYFLAHLTRSCRCFCQIGLNFFKRISQLCMPRKLDSNSSCTSGYINLTLECSNTLFGVWCGSEQSTFIFSDHFMSILTVYFIIRIAKGPRDITVLITRSANLLQNSANTNLRIVYVVPLLLHAGLMWEEHYAAWSDKGWSNNSVRLFAL